MPRTFTMTADAEGCPDGVNAKPYLAGETYTLDGPHGESLASAFVANGVAVEGDQAQAQAPAKKGKPGPTETKVEAPAETKVEPAPDAK